MTSEKQIEANRRNAKKSTGPRTAEGKATVACNATKHGLTGKQVVTPWEDPQEFEELRARVHESLQPDGAVNECLVDLIAAHLWRLRRIPGVEAGLFARHYAELTIEKAIYDVAKYGTEQLEEVISELSDDGSHNGGSSRKDAVARLCEGKLSAEDAPMIMSRAFRANGGAFESLARYEAAIDGALVRDLGALRR